MFLVWKRVAIGFLFLETFLFVLIYSFGPHGLSMVKNLEQSYFELERRCEQLNDNIEKIEQDIAEWEKSSFLKEKVAREKLLMKKPGEIIYFR